MFELLAEPADDIDAVEFRHGNIQHDDIRLGFQGEFHRTHAVRRLADPAVPPLLRPSQGVHLVVDHEFLPGSDAMLVPRTADGRVLFAIPWQGRVLLGTTDTPRRDTPLEPRPLPGEVDFILATAARHLARAPTRTDVRSAFVGLRPLIGAGDASATRNLSREHVVEVSSRGLVSVTGGKWTTYRLMAADAVDATGPPDAAGVPDAHAARASDITMADPRAGMGRSQFTAHSFPRRCQPISGWACYWWR